MKDVANNGSNDMESIEVDFAKVRICIYRQMIGVKVKSMVWCRLERGVEREL